VWQHTITYNNILIPVCDFSLEYIDSAANDSVFSTTLSKELASDLGLIGQPQTFDLFTDQGVRATCNVVDNSDNSNSNKQLFYIKEDLLKKVLKENDLTLIWAIWGERKYSYDHMKNFTYKLDRPDPTYKVFNFIKRYDPSK
jgi:hypothetical protein